MSSRRRNLWQATIAFLDTVTPDGRMLAGPKSNSNMISTAILPLPLLEYFPDKPDVLIGFVHHVWVDGKRLKAVGEFDMKGSAGRQAALKVYAMSKNGASIRIDGARHESLAKIDQANDWRLVSVLLTEMPMFPSLRIETREPRD